MAPMLDLGQWLTAMSLSEHLAMLLAYLKVLAWPAIVLLGLFFFRLPIGELIARAESWTGPMNFGGKFSKNAAQNRAHAEAVESAEAAESPEAPGQQLPQRPKSVAADEAVNADPERTPNGSAHESNHGLGSDSDSHSHYANSDPPSDIDVERQLEAILQNSLALPQQANQLIDETALGLLVSRWGKLEGNARYVSNQLSLGEQFPVLARNPGDVPGVFRALAVMGSVPAETIAIARKTRELRNQAVHGYLDVRAEAVDDVLDTIAFLERTLQKAGMSLIAQKILRSNPPSGESDR